jgi:hypothetical protein
MIARGITPILNVSDIRESFAWFEKLGWSKQWEWGDRPDFASVGSDGVEIFLCRNGHGRCTCGIPTATSSESARDSRKRKARTNSDQFSATAGRCLTMIGTTIRAPLGQM